MHTTQTMNRGSLKTACGWFHMLALFLGLTVNFAAAQTRMSSIIVMDDPGPYRVNLPPGMELPPGVTLPDDLNAAALSTNATDSDKSPEEKRLEQLLKLKFDRNASSILNALAGQFDDPATTNEVELFQQDVIVGDWQAAGDYLSKLPEDHGEQVYRHLIKELSTTVQAGNRRPTPNSPQLGAQGIVVSGGNQQGPANQAAPTLVVVDVLTLAEIAPHELTKADARQLGQLLGKLLRRGDALEPLLPKLEQGVRGLGGTAPEDRRRAADLLLGANRLTEAAQFLAPVETAKQDQDWASLAEHARDLALRGQREQDSALLEQAWEINQFILRSPESSAKDRGPALKRCLDLMPRLTRQVGTNWLRESFRDDPSRGLAILGAVSETAQSGLKNRNTSQRQKNLELQKRTVDLFLSVADPEQPHWRTALNLLAQTWMQEGTWSKQRSRPSQSYNNPIYDQYGNIISYQSTSQSMRSSGNQMPPIDPAEVVASAPGKTWLANMDESLRLAVIHLIADLHLKTDTPERALPFIEVISGVQPQDAEGLANALLRAWATAHDPTRQQQRSQQRIMSGGVVYYTSGSSMSRMPNRIALTRTMQVRNIEELSELLRRLESLDLPKLSDNALVGAFTAAHSPAEVFRRSDIESVFGDIEQIELGILADVAQVMRQRLANQWRSPRLQQQMKTKRIDDQIDAEVLRGYEIVLDLIEQGLRREADHWKLNLARATAFFDLAEFEYGQEVDLEIYVQKREEAFDGYEHAALLYADALENIPENEQTPEVYRQWFNANLGASDLAFVTRQQEPETDQLARVRAAMLALPGEAAERHLSAFARSLGQTARSLKPELKPRYLRAGLTVVGDHPDADEARKLVTYYSDLLREIELVVRLDGEEVVGHSRPFGVFVSLLHTADIEREAGGFARYLRNLNNRSSAYYPNPSGQQQRNFVKDFDQQVREKIVDGFEIKSITFPDEKTKSRGYGREGWRETPLAYLLLQAKDGAADRLPAFQMDLDFADSSGPVVLPVQSQITLLDARPERVASRPVADLELTQTLDDRDLANAELTLEVQARGKGIVPEINELLDTNFPGLQVIEVTDLGVTVTQIDTESDAVAPVTERNWLFKLSANESATASLTFQFPAATSDDVTTTYKRYADADLIEVEPKVALSGLKLRPRPPWHWALLGGLVITGTGGIVWWSRQPKPAEAGASPSYALPEDATAFTLISLLRRMERDKSLCWPESNREELSQTIQTLERRFFARESNGEPEPDLGVIGKRWVHLAGTRE